MSDLSRVEQLLRNALGEDIYEVTPQSRVEELLAQLNELIEGISASVDPEELTPIVTAWLAENIHDGAVVDTSLSVAGAAAESKKTGDEISQLKEDLNAVNSNFTAVVGKNLANTDGAQLGLITSRGTLDTGGSGSSYKTTDFIELEANTDYSYACFNNNTYKEVNSSPRKAVLLYNASKEPVSATYVSQNNVANVTFNSGDGYKYARISYVYQTALPQLEKGTDYTYYMPYTSKTKLVSLLGDEPLEQIADVYGDFAQCFDIDLHDAATDVVGVLNGAGRVDATGTGTSYKTSTYISIKAGYKYVFAHPRKICLYNADKVFSEIIDNSSNNEYVYSAVQDCLARFSYLNTQTDSSVKITYDGSYSRKLDEAIDFSIRQKSTIDNMIAEKNGDPLYGKKWAVCGDSFTNDGGTGTKITDGKYTGKSFTYPWIIGNRHNMNIVKFFEGGRTLAFPAVPDTFVNSLTNPNADWFYQNIPSDVDFITIYLGINDEHHAPSSSGGDGEDNTGEIPIGTVNDETTATYLGAWNVVLTWLITNRPNAHIGIIVTNGIAGKDEYRQGQIAIATKYGIPYIDLNGDARTPAMLRTSNPNIPSTIKQALIQKWAVDPSSNTHPNDAAQLFESHFIENFLRSI